ncbi:MAG: 3-dehydroquinate synthase II [Candidatus Micrarchaeota archaeon]
MKEIWVESRALAKKFALRHTGEKGKWTEVKIRGERDIQKLKEAAKAGAERAVISCPNWAKAPQKELNKLEKKLKIIAKVKNSEEAKIADELLDKTISGFLLHNAKTFEIDKLKRYLSGEGVIILEAATVSEIKPTGSGERSCIDTCEIMTSGEGMLVGSDSTGFVLVQAEASTEDSRAEPRPFRVNAGAVSLHTLLAGNKTEFLAEIQAGDDVLIVDRSGKERKAVVGRNRIERRPLVLITAKHKLRAITAFLQNSENVCLLTPKGAKPVPKLRKGDEILVHLRGKKEEGLTR